MLQYSVAWNSQRFVAGLSLIVVATSLAVALPEGSLQLASMLALGMIVGLRGSRTD